MDTTLSKRDRSYMQYQDFVDFDKIHCISVFAHFS